MGQDSYLFSSSFSFQKSYSDPKLAFDKNLSFMIADPQQCIHPVLGDAVGPERERQRAPQAREAGLRQARRR